jgi:hypothetical protein
MVYLGSGNHATGRQVPMDISEKELLKFAGDAKEFHDAIQKFQTDEDKLFLSWSEVLVVVWKLGYRKEGRSA